MSSCSFDDAVTVSPAAPQPSLPPVRTMPLEPSQSCWNKPCTRQLRKTAGSGLGPTPSARSRSPEIGSRTRVDPDHPRSHAASPAERRPPRHPRRRSRRAPSPPRIPGGGTRSPDPPSRRSQSPPRSAVPPHPTPAVDLADITAPPPHCPKHHRRHPLASATVAPSLRSECAPNSAGSSPTEAMNIVPTARACCVVTAAPVAGSRDRGARAAPPTGTGSSPKSLLSAL